MHLLQKYFSHGYGVSRLIFKVWLYKWNFSWSLSHLLKICSLFEIFNPETSGDVTICDVSRLLKPPNWNRKSTYLNQSRFFKYTYVCKPKSRLWFCLDYYDDVCKQISCHCFVFIWISGKICDITSLVCICKPDPVFCKQNKRDGESHKKKAKNLCNAAVWLLNSTAVKLIVFFL